MLTDREKECLDFSATRAREREQIETYGNYIRGLDQWSWFGTITSRYKSGPSAKAVDRLLCDLQKAAGHPIRWVVAWERGEIGGRLHCHFLVARVDHLDLETWRRRANAQFGQAHIDRYNSSDAGAFYIAVNGCTDDGRLEFGGAA